MTKISNETIIKASQKQITKDPFTSTNRWVKGFLHNNDSIQCDALSMLKELQTKAVIDGMTKHEPIIHIPQIGRFVLSEARVEFSETIKSNPTMSKEDIEAKVVSNYIARKKQSKKKRAWVKTKLQQE